MKEYRYVVEDNNGLHARPAGMLAATCKDAGRSVTCSLQPESVQSIARRQKAMRGMRLVGNFIILHHDIDIFNTA